MFAYYFTIADMAQDEDGKCPCQHISAEHGCKKEIGQQIERLP